MSPPVSEAMLRAVPRGVVVDLDGTMVDTLDDFVASLQKMAHDLALGSVQRSFVEASIGKGSEHLVSEALRHLGAPASLYDTAYAAYQRAYAECNGRAARVYPGVREGLDALVSRGMPLVCLTNKPTRFAQGLLEQLGLSHYFVGVSGGDAFARKKPDPLPLLETCRALGLAPADVLMIGDSSNDAEAARAAGCPVVLVSYGYNHGQPVREIAADGFVDRLDQVTSLFGDV